MDLKSKWQEAMDCTGFENTETDTEYRLDIDHKAQTIKLSFQGSSRFIRDGKITIDWRQNFDFLKKPYKHMKHIFFVHRGIHNKYQSVRDDIYNKIKDLKDYDMYIFGFSQGGGLDYCAHEDYWYKGFDPITYAFASPRIFGWWNCRILKERFKKFHIVINVNDIVPKLPPVLFGFRHYGIKHKIGKLKITFPWNLAKEHMGYKDLI